MKGFEKRLLERLKHNDIEDNNEPLKNVKNSFGEVQYVAGNPLTKTEITLSIRQGWGGAIEDRFRQPIPMYLFSLTDSYSGYATLKNYFPPKEWIIYNNPVSDTSWQGFIGFTLSKQYFNNNYYFFSGLCENGDFVEVYVNKPLPDLWFTRIIHCNNVPYSTLINSMASDLISINTMRLIVPIANVDQFTNPINIGRQTIFGKVYMDDVDPRNYITNKDFQQQICDIPLNLPIDKTIIMEMDVNYDLPQMQIVLFVEKVEALTHKI